MVYDESIRFSGKRIAAVFNSLRNIILREVVYRIVKRTLLKEPSLENPGGRVAGLGDSGGELSRKAIVISRLWVRDWKER